MTIKIPEFIESFKRNWVGIVVHHSAQPDGVVSEWEGIKRFHTSWRYKGNTISKEKATELELIGTKGVLQPWADIGYHAGIEQDGDEIKIKVGRPLHIIGAHAVGFNSSHIGICVVGNYDKTDPLDRLQIARELCLYFMKRYNIDSENVLGHRETFVKRGVPVEKSCPGILWNMDFFRRSLV